MYHFVGGAFLVLFGMLYLLVPVSGESSIPVLVGFSLLAMLLILTGLIEIAVSLNRTPLAEKRRTVGGVACIVFGIGASPLAIMDLVDPGTPLSEGIQWIAIATVMPATGIYYLKGGGSFGKPTSS